MKKIALFLVFAIVSCLIVSPVQASQTSVDPDTVWLTLSPGESAQVQKTVIVPAIIPKGDILFAFDLTGSMADEIDTAKVYADSIMKVVSALVSDPYFGVISYMDYPDSFTYCGYSAWYGDLASGDYAYQLDLALTSNTAAVAAAIFGLTTGNGRDGPQDYTRIFYESYADSYNIGYRPGAKRILLNFADDVPHDCDLNLGIPGSTSVWSTGGDPGRDEVMGNADDLDLQTVLGEMASNGVTLMEIHGNTYWPGGSLPYWEHWCSLTGGGLFHLADISQIPAAIESLILEQALYIDSLTLKEMTAGFESWLTMVDPPYYLDIEAPDTLYFTEEITVPPDSSCGKTYVFQISAIGDGVSYGDQIVIVTVPCGVVRVPGDTCVYQGKMACIPVYLDSLPPWSVYSAQWVMYYDEAVLHATHAQTENTIAEHWGDPTYNIGDGWIAIGMAGTDSLDTTGVLVWVCFDVVGEIGDTTLLTFEDDQIILNDSTFDAREGLVRVCPEEYIICGRVRYCLNDEPVRCAELMLSGGKDDTVHANANGCYCFPHLPVGLDYTVKADKTDDYRGAISAFDASLVLRYVVSLLDLTPCQLIAGDVTGNCWVNAYDASFILKRVVHLIPQFPIGKDWKFIPDDFLLDTLNWCTAPDSIFYDSLSEDWCFEDWKGILYGDLSGNWGSVLLAGRDHPEDILSRLVVKDIMVNPGEEFIVPIQVEDVSELYSAELGLSYDNSLLSLESVTPGDLLSGCYFEKNLTPGEIRLAAAGTQPIQGSGDLAYLTFKVLPQAQEGTTTELQVSRFCLNEASTGGFAFNVSIGSGTTTHPMEFSLAQNYPNPFNPETEIGFSLPVDCRVQLRIYNVTGQLVKVYQKDYPAGAHSISWDGTNMKGENVGSGIYFYRMEAGDFVQQKKMVLMR